jgi:amidase
MSLIDRVNPALNAVVALNPERTLAEATKADEARARGKNGALLGLPLTIKDSIDAEGFVSTGGSLARRDFVPARDATVVARIRSAGGIVLGKTNVPEYISSFETDNLVYGRTNNPYDLDRTPGGSSGGEAAILAAEASPLGIGSDGGGSIRVPAHYCGITGLRPTVGLIPETGAWPPSRSTGSLDIHTLGPMGRYVEDIALLLSVVAGPDGQDPFAVPVPIIDWRAVEPRRLRAAYYSDDPLTTPTAETRAAVATAAAALEALGNDVVAVTPTRRAAEATELFFACAGADGGARMRADVAAAAGQHHPQFATLLAYGLDETPPTAASFFATLERVHAFRAEMRALMGKYDVILCPAAAGPAPLHGTPPQGVPQEEYFRYEAFNYTHTYSVAGLPSAVVPAGRDPQGLPIGVQIVAAPFRDADALAVAAALQRTIELPPPASTST